MGTYFKQQDLDRLRDLRQTLIGIEGRPPGEDAPRYWRDRRDIELYDLIFGTRIGWKWDAVLDELESRHGFPEVKTVVDWGTGTGVAVRKVLDRIPGIESITLFDRDEAVLEFAKRSIREAFPNVKITAVTEAPGEKAAEKADLAIASHVLDELDQDGIASLRGTLDLADHVLWVEPGSKKTSRDLSMQRDTFLDDFQVLGPCVHQGTCGVLTPDHKKDWCHLFAKPPAEVHTTGEWSEIHRELRIDLRSLPYSFISLRRRSLGAAEPEQVGSRLLQRPRFSRGKVLLELCDADGVRQDQMLQRTDKKFYKELKDTAGKALFLEVSDGAAKPV